MAIDARDVGLDHLAAHVASALMDYGGAAVIIGRGLKDRKEFFELVRDTLSSSGTDSEQLPTEIVKAIADHMFVVHISAEESDRLELSELVCSALNTRPGFKALMFLRGIRSA